MKKMIFSFLFILTVSINIRSQIIVIPVTDVAHIPASITYWAEELAKEYSKLMSMRESQGYLLESINFYKKVHDKMNNSLLVFSILEKQYTFYAVASNALSLPSENIGSEKCYTKYCNKVKALIEKSTHNVQNTKDFIKEGMYQMNDSERLEAAERIEQKTNELYSNLYALKRHFEESNRRILAVKALSNK